MRTAAKVRHVPTPPGLAIEQVNSPKNDWYRDLFRRVGGLDWLWFSRLSLSDTELSEILQDDRVELYALVQNGAAEGMVELDFRVPGECELAFFGVTKALIGKGAGRMMMNHAITQAWSRPIQRFHVHTCTLDSQAALGFYQRSGFQPIRQQVEIADDPRLNGNLPRDAGPHIPLFSTE